MDFDGKYYTLKRGKFFHHASPERMFQTKEEALASLDAKNDIDKDKAPVMSM